MSISAVKLDKIMVHIKDAVVQLDASEVHANQAFDYMLNSCGVISAGRSMRKRKHNPVERMLVNGNCLIYRVKGKLEVNLETGNTYMDQPLVEYKAIGYQGNRQNYHHGQKRKKLLARIAAGKVVGFNITALRSNIPQP